MLIIDSHMHCGIQNVSLPFNNIKPLLHNAGITKACVFAPVEDIYYRYSLHFNDDRSWRECRVRAHEYLLKVAQDNDGIYPYYFVWNDFSVEDLNENFYGIKWHHHDGEPVYNYSDPQCVEMIDAICERKLPVVLEETFETTMQFIERINSRTAVIIPHLGLLNGGFEILFNAGIWENKNIYADTALAGYREITGFLEEYGPDRLIFGSDYPFGSPKQQLEKIKSMMLDEQDMEKICSGNILKLFKR